MEHHTKNKKLDEQLTKLVTIIAACALGVVIGSVAIWSHEKESGIAVDALIQKNGILKSSYDPREYRALRLENGIIALLISDKRSIVSAASVDVASGSMMDPWDYQGLAHFCEVINQINQGMGIAISWRVSYSFEGIILCLSISSFYQIQER